MKKLGMIKNKEKLDYATWDDATTYSELKIQSVNDFDDIIIQFPDAEGKKSFNSIIQNVFS